MTWGHAKAAALMSLTLDSGYLPLFSVLSVDIYSIVVVIIINLLRPITLCTTRGIVIIVLILIIVLMPFLLQSTLDLPNDHLIVIEIFE